jgi:hypothetical protein
MKRNEANSARIGIATFIVFLAVYLVSPHGAGICSIPPGSLGTCTAVSSTPGKTTLSCSEATGVSCSESIFSYPYVLLPLGIVAGAASALAYLLIGLRKGRLA